MPPLDMCGSLHFISLVVNVTALTHVAVIEHYSVEYRIVPCKRPSPNFDSSVLCEVTAYLVEFLHGNSKVQDLGSCRLFQ